MKGVGKDRRGRVLILVGCRGTVWKRVQGWGACRSGEFTSPPRRVAAVCHGGLNSPLHSANRITFAGDTADNRSGEVCHRGWRGTAVPAVTVHGRGRPCHAVADGYNSQFGCSPRLGVRWHQTPPSACASYHPSPRTRARVSTGAQEMVSGTFFLLGGCGRMPLWAELGEWMSAAWFTTS
jgi:hypothetical protein